MIRTCHPSIHSSIPPTMSPHPNPPFTCLGVRRFSPPSPSPNPTPASGNLTLSGGVGGVGRSKSGQQHRPSLICLCLRPHLFSPGLLLPLATVQDSHPPRSKKGGDRQGVRRSPLTRFSSLHPHLNPSFAVRYQAFALTHSPFAITLSRSTSWA